MAKRLGKLQAFLREQKLDALLIKSKTMKKYMDTLTGSGCQILLMRDQGYLIVDGRYLVEANEREHDLQIVQHMPHTGGNGYLGVVEELLHKHGGGELAATGEGTLAHGGSRCRYPFAG